MLRESLDPDRSVRAARRGAIAAALCGWALLIAVFFPGFTTQDSAAQYAQVHGASLDDIHPVAMVLLWRVCEALWTGPGGLFVLLQTVAWSALAMFAAATQRTAPRAVLLVLLVGLWPAYAIISAHLWKDVGMVALVLLGVALLALEANARHPRRGLLIGAAIVLTLATGFRHGSIPLVLPLAAWIGWRWDNRRTARSRAWNVLCAMLLVAIGASVGSRVVDALAGVDRRANWTIGAIWDIAGVSLARHEMLIPDYVAPTLTLEVLERAFTPWTNTTIYETQLIRHGGYYDFTPEQLSDLRLRWLGLGWNYPAEYIAHRARLMSYLFGLRNDELPLHRFFAPEHRVPSQDALPPRAGEMQQGVLRAATMLVATPMFMGWAYVLLALVALLLALRRRGDPVAALMVVLLVSALAYTGLIANVATSAEFRYLLWLVVASVLATTTLLLRPR